jgi:uncharacterized Zn finger protein
MSRYSYSSYPAYVSKAEKEATAKKRLAEGKGCYEPVTATGRKFTVNFWGQAWEKQILSFQDYAYRLERGRSYLRAGSVVHLGISQGEIDAKVSGSSLYAIKIKIKPLSPERWADLKKRCGKGIGSVLELLQGKISTEVMKEVTDNAHGLLPLNSEITKSCSCPDSASLCKHLAAVFYGIGVRLDSRPELLFTLRGVDPSELVSQDLVSNLTGASSTRRVDDDLSALFGIDMEDEAQPANTTPVAKAAPSAKAAQKKPGRPKKTEAAPSAKAAQKKPGRPKKTEAAPTAKAVAQKKPGRPKKTEAAPTAKAVAQKKPKL